MFVIKNRNPAFGWYNFEGWTQDQSKATQYPTAGEAHVIIQRYNMQADAVEVEQPDNPPE